MGSDLFSADLTNFLEKALGVQIAEREQVLTKEKLKEIARNAGLSEEDWEDLCEKLNGHLAKGRNFLKFANFADAITDLEPAVAIAPYRADVLVDCGKAHFGRWKETGTRSSRDRAETMFRKSLEIDPDNVDAADQLSRLKQSKPVSRTRRGIAAMAAVLLLTGGVSAWVGMHGLFGKLEGTRADSRIEVQDASSAASGLTNALADTKWLWHGREDFVVTLSADGRFIFDDWRRQGITAEWRATGPKEVTVTVTSQKFRNLTAVLVFDSGLSSFTGTDLDPKRKISKSPRVRAGE